MRDHNILIILECKHEDTHFPKVQTIKHDQALQLVFGPFLHHHTNSFHMILRSNFGFPLQHHKHQRGRVALGSCRWLLNPDWGVSPSPSAEWCRHCWTVTAVPTVGWSTSVWPSESRSCSLPHGCEGEARLHNFTQLNLSEPHEGPE